MINSVNYFDRSIVFSINISDHSDIADIVWKAVVLNTNNLGRIHDFKLGGDALKKIAPSGGRRENSGGISCENSRFYAKKADYRISLLPLTSNSKNKTVVSKLHCMSNL
jgi:hypothetical protein